MPIATALEVGVGAGQSCVSMRSKPLRYSQGTANGEYTLLCPEQQDRRRQRGRAPDSWPDCCGLHTVDHAYCYHHDVQCFAYCHIPLLWCSYAYAPMLLCLYAPMLLCPRCGAPPQQCATKAVQLQSTTAVQLQRLGSALAGRGSKHPAHALTTEACVHACMRAAHMPAHKRAAIIAGASNCCACLRTSTQRFLNMPAHEHAATAAHACARARSDCRALRSASAAEVWLHDSRCT